MPLHIYRSLPLHKLWRHMFTQRGYPLPEVFLTVGLSLDYFFCLLIDWCLVPIDRIRASRK
jgi:hypothetical protein